MIRLSGQRIEWAKLPSYYCGEKFIRIIPFKDHINIKSYLEIFVDEE